MFTQNFKFSTCSHLFIRVYFTCGMLMNFFEWKIEDWKERKELVFLEIQHKRWQYFLHRYIYDNNNENIYMFIYKKKLKKYLHRFNKTFSNYHCLKNQAIFSQSEHRYRFNPSPPPVWFDSLFKDLPLPLHNKPFTKKGLLEDMEGFTDNAIAFMHLNIKANK